MSEKTVEGTTVESLNRSSYNRFRDYLRWRNPDLRYNQMNDDEFNRRLKIVKEDKLTFGGLLFLGKNEAKPRIRVFTNRLEFENPGMLPRPVEELLIADESLPRNPVLAKFFRIAKMCESAGFGFGKMLEWKKETGNDVFFETRIDKTKAMNL
jgi:predicted HTH transcriptional regulator